MSLPQPPTVPSNLPSIAKAQLPETYKGAVTALTQCQDVDECADWKDKAAALASYAKQAQNESLYRMAIRIQARAIKRCGELLKQWDDKARSPGPGRGKTASTVPDAVLSPRAQVAEQAGLSRDARHAAVQMANIPDEVFEAAVEREEPPTPRQLLEEHRATKVTPIHDSLRGLNPADFKQATALQGALERFPRELQAIDIVAAVRGTHDHEREEMVQQAQKIVALCAALLEQLEGASHE